MSKVFGVPAAVSWPTVASFLWLIQDRDIPLFVELGVYLGGTASAMIARAMWVPEFHYLGFDFEMGNCDARVKLAVMNRPNAELLSMDMLSTPALAIVKDRRDGLCTQAPMLVFVDGFKKSVEFEAYKPLIRPGDYIAVHDFDETNLLGPDFLHRKEIVPLVESGQWKDMAEEKWWADTAFGTLMLQRRTA